MIHFTDTTKHVIDTISVTAVIGTLTAWLPPIAALLSIIWTVLRIYEMISGEQLSDRRKEVRHNPQHREHEDNIKRK